MFSRHFLFLVPLYALLLVSCRVGNGDRPLVGGSYDVSGSMRTTSSMEDGEDALEENALDDAVLEEDADLLPAPLTDRPEQRLMRKAYSVSYNSTTRLPNWVQWTLTADHTDGRYSRRGQQFHEDEEVATPRATHYDYMRSGYDRGHMCPSGDNKWDAEAQEQSFLLTNVCPQNHDLNTGDWNELEIQCRRWAKRYGRIYIVCGPVLYRQKHKTIGRNRVVVPEAFFKVVLRLGDEPACIAFIYRNKEGNRPKGDYVNSLREVERITKIHFFSGLDSDIRAQIEDHADINDW